MKISKLNISVLIMLIALLALTGCSWQKPDQIVLGPRMSPTSYESTNVKRFEQPDTEKATVVESAMVLSGKYTELSEKNSELKDRSQSLLNENIKLKTELTKLTADIQQTQAELSQANQLLFDMRVELNNWKINVIGFREEIRQADAEQLKALVKILKVLGGEETSLTQQLQKTETKNNISSGS